jgi:hypothetical protein
MVEMRVRQHHGIQLLKGAFSGNAIKILDPTGTLEEPAIDQDLCIARFKDIGRPRHFTAAGAVDRYFHLESFQVRCCGENRICLGCDVTVPGLRCEGLELLGTGSQCPDILPSGKVAA